MNSNPNLTLTLVIVGIAALAVILLFIGIHHSIRKAREQREEFERDVARARREMEERRERERQALAERQAHLREVLGLEPRGGAAAGIAGGLASRGSTDGVPRKPGKVRELGAPYGQQGSHLVDGVGFFAQQAAAYDYTPPVGLDAVVQDHDDDSRRKHHHSDPVIESSAHDHSSHSNDSGGYDSSSGDSGGGDSGCSCSD